MHWLLVVIVMGAPVKTDLVFTYFRSCLQAEQDMRKQWSDALNAMMSQKSSQASLDFVASQATPWNVHPGAVRA